MRSKQRLTITLPEELVVQLDRLGRQQDINNRSFLIEQLLKQVVPFGVGQAVILAGGGKKTHQTLLSSIGGETLLARLLLWLKQNHVSRVIMCADLTLAEQIKAIFQKGEGMGIEIVYSPEEKPLGTAGALQAASQFLEKSPFLVVHADVVTDLNLNQFVDFHCQEAAMATIAVKPRLSEPKFGQVFLQGNKIIKFVAGGDPQLPPDKGISIVDTGVYVCQWEILGQIPAHRPCFLEKEVFPQLANQKALAAYFFQGFWADVSDPVSLKSAQSYWSTR